MTDNPLFQRIDPDREKTLLKAAEGLMTAAEVRTLIDRVNSAHDAIKRYSTPTGQWYHVSPHNISVGTTLVPGGLEPDKPTSGEFYTRDGFDQDTGNLADMGAGRAHFVWLTIDREDADFWADTLKASYIYEVQPTDMPRPWNGTGVDGWVTTAAVIIGVVSKP